MWLKALNTRKVAEVGTSLADEFVLAASDQGAGRKAARGAGPQNHRLQTFLAQVDREARPLALGVFRRAKLANSFKWRLLDKGVEPDLVNELTQMLLVRLSENQGDLTAGGSVNPTRPDSVTPGKTASSPSAATTPGNVAALLTRADDLAAQFEHAAAVDCYLELLELEPRHLRARNSLGLALGKLGRHAEAEEQFRRAISIRPNDVEAQLNLGSLLLTLGRYEEAELPLRRALKLDPRRVGAHVNLGIALLMLQRPGDAEECFSKVLKIVPRHATALYGLGQVASQQGRFEEAEALYKRALVFETRMPLAWAALVSLRKMTSADAAWLREAEKIASSGIAPMQEAALRFAIGKYCDDTGDFERAFRSYKQGNELRRTCAERYLPEARESFVDDMIRVYSRDSFAAGQTAGSDSVKPVFVVGMMRSGTSLVEQIISSHPAARGAGEPPFWNNTARKHAEALRSQWIDETLRRKLAKTYLQQLTSHAPEALRIVDKTPVNSDYLGLIHSVFPRARVIYVRRDPIDTCLSCHFTELSPAFSYTMDLSDLAHYYRQHRRLMDHWRAVLPEGTLLDVPYAELVVDPEKWTRKIVDFLGLEWDERCLAFHETQRPVMTASFWQVRQKIYGTSVGRWRNYKKFIAPLMELRDLGP